VSAPHVALLLGWGVLVGLDLVSLPQVMIARPLVAGTVAGWALGDASAGALVGAILELFALEVLPVGGVRYPDYGPAAIGAAAAAAGAPGVLGLGAAVSVGLLVALVGERSIQTLRALNAADVRRNGARLDAGEWGAVRGCHLRGLLRDAVRSLLLTALGLALAALVRQWPPITLHGAILLSIVVTGVGLGTGALAAIRLAERPRALGWFAVGLLGGIAWVVWR
jgi:mannose/fructose/N-acetylgalactosamine-specific phosphotransferase system component IIC